MVNSFIRAAQLPSGHRDLVTREELNLTTGNILRRQVRPDQTFQEVIEAARALSETREEYGEMLLRVNNFVLPEDAGPFYQTLINFVFGGGEVYNIDTGWQKERIGGALSPSEIQRFNDTWDQIVSNQRLVSAIADMAQVPGVRIIQAEDRAILSTSGEDSNILIQVIADLVLNSLKSGFRQVHMRDGTFEVIRNFDTDMELIGELEQMAELFDALRANQEIELLLTNQQGIENFRGWRSNRISFWFDLLSQVDIEKGSNEFELNVNLKPGIIFMKILSSEVNFGTKKIVLK